MFLYLASRSLTGSALSTLSICYRQSSMPAPALPCVSSEECWNMKLLPKRGLGGGVTSFGSATDLRPAAYCPCYQPGLLSCSVPDTFFMGRSIHSSEYLFSRPVYGSGETSLVGLGQDVSFFSRVKSSQLIRPDPTQPNQCSFT